MLFWSTLLRLFLVVALVFNTMGTAVASVHLDHQGAMEAAQVSKVATTEAPPCHEHQQATAAATEVQPAAAPEATRKPHSTPDCCKSGACRCACVHHAPALMIALGFYPLIIEHAKSARPMSSGHAPPALPHLSRPPSGYVVPGAPGAASRAHRLRAPRWRTVVRQRGSHSPEPSRMLSSMEISCHPILSAVTPTGC
jgi:hypothetical protein